MQLAPPISSKGSTHRDPAEPERTPPVGRGTRQHVRPSVAVGYRMSNLSNLITFAAQALDTRTKEEVASLERRANYAAGCPFGRTYAVKPPHKPPSGQAPVEPRGTGQQPVFLLR